MTDTTQVHLPLLPEPIQIEWPIPDSQKLHREVDVFKIRDVYHAANFGWQEGFGIAVESFPKDIYTSKQMQEYALAAVKAEQEAPEHIHSCGYHCDIPACVKDQRDKLVNSFITALDYPSAWDVMAYPTFESALKEVYSHFKQVKQEARELSDDEERKAFENWYFTGSEPFDALARHGESYKYPDTVCAWNSWKARALLSRKQDAKREAALQELADISQENNIGYGDKE